MNSQPEDIGVLEFLVGAGREFRRGGWVFTGFHWPMLAVQVAHALSGQPFVQAFEAGASTHGPARLVPTSTTDYSAYDNVLGYAGDTASMLLAMPRRFDRVVLDASNIDIRGRVNSSCSGPQGWPRSVYQVAAVPLTSRRGPASWCGFPVPATSAVSMPEWSTSLPRRLRTRSSGCTRDGESRCSTRAPHVEEVADRPGADEFVRHLEGLAVRIGDPVQRPSTTDNEREAALQVLRGAADWGYQVARRLFQQAERT